MEYFFEHPMEHVLLDLVQDKDVEKGEESDTCGGANRQEADQVGSVRQEEGVQTTASCI